MLLIAVLLVACHYSSPSELASRGPGQSIRVIPSPANSSFINFDHLSVLPTPIWELFSFLLPSFFSVVFANSEIVGGNDAQIGSYPYQVGLEVDGEFYCGGSIISDMYIVTAAHCKPLPKWRSKDLGLRARAGSTTLGSGGQLVDVSKFWTSHQYDSITSHH